MTEDHLPKAAGNYWYLPAGRAFSAGIAILPGYEVRELRLAAPATVRDGLATISEALTQRSLPAGALAALDLRSPRAVDREHFEEFNEGYLALLREYGFIDGAQSPIARTNIVPTTWSGPDHPYVLAASVVTPCLGRAGGTDFVLAGRGETDRSAGTARIVAHGDVSRSGLTKKMEFVADSLRERVALLGRSVADINVVNVYCEHEVSDLGDVTAKHLTDVGSLGVVRWSAHPPLTDVEFEMDVRRISGWEVVGS